MNHLGTFVVLSIAGHKCNLRQPERGLARQYNVQICTRTLLRSPGCGTMPGMRAWNSKPVYPLHHE